MTAPESSVSSEAAAFVSPVDKPIGVAVLGMGNVGSEVVRILLDHATDLTARVGAPLVLRGVAVRDIGKDRGIDPDLLTTDVRALVARDDVDLVVEVLGGIEPARELILAALNAGKSVVTANKALLAEYTGELADAAESHRADLYFEAAVAGAIPVVRPLMQSLAGDRVNRVIGIVNGTTNFILSAMDETGADYADTLAEAGRLGYAEADPTADVEGFDAAAKAAILASLAFHTRVTSADVHREGISSITAADIATARAFDCTVKLLALCERVSDDDGNDRISVRVYPSLVPLSHPLASVSGAFNAVVVEAEAAGRLMFYGQGAGGAPTASAVMGDLVMAARNKFYGGRGPGESTYAKLPVAPMGDTPTRYHVNMQVADRAGVLSAVAAEFAKNDVSISTVRQEGASKHARLVVVTHRAKDSALAATVDALKELDIVTAVTSVLRLEGTSE
ncbi:MULTISPECIES: homoserine dehydrogenase [unclassified Rhodococcus (in: high G+C Gram-positive bacteria)]|uniref:homoserine dehydrogenase n=1 Tax=unclassified Rhodococcus (in: high G+C Gram-positive bacteria) TaxID=192944 RepID=UPI000AB8FEB2|nr:MULTISPECIES: homoserine dehydrogenase [unclassified Rhodococcus (in: high G+C Gram-positive bacteria)]MBY6679340.1 homoserine dehydrogenase [Rhodococcus sp. BP-332]MBY6682529.1 homoserine dehydrogenase [Rhodococcus sp. BP-316]MBY6687415.1 homoserine dehydrogenase [Rhodococcus sp. BP-288]MBY6694162.1 homoserine dehydrogenase [Rhodococcus sp. BP-188]MBY6697871.1 homoserine dehydrogenase [Rhodococcus sp. BP-285]